MDCKPVLAIPFALALGAACPGAGAQGLSGVVVTANRAETPIADALSDITVIDADAIARAGAQSLPDLLRAQAGIEVSRNGNEASLAGIFARGMKTSQTVVLVDGVRLENPTSGTANLEFLPLAAIERIEVVRGPLSTLYGSGAMGGVIQIFTRQGEGAFRPFVSAGVGSLGTSRLQTGVSGAGGEGQSTRFSASVSLDRTDGYEATRPANPNYQSDRDGNRRVGATAALSHRLTADWHAGASVLLSDGRARYDDAWSTPETALFDYRSSVLSGFLRGRVADGWQTELRVGDTRIDYRYDAFAYAPRTGSQTLAWQNTLAFGGGRVLAGIEQLRQRIDGEGLTTPPYAYLRDARRTDSVFLGYERAIDRHQFRLQVRNDRIEALGAEPSVAFGWAYRLTPALLVRAAWAEAFRAPTFDDLYNPFGANPDLKPERSRNGELAIEYRQNGSLLKATAFSSRIRDAIELDPSYIPRNIDSARVTGLALEARRRFGAFAVRGNATFQDPRGERFDPVSGEIVSGQLARRARQFASIGVDWQPSTWRLGAEWVLQGRRIDSQQAPMPGYGVLALSASQPLSRGLDLFARIDNVGDRSYETAWGYPMPPRTVFVGLRYQAQ